MRKKNLFSDRTKEKNVGSISSGTKVKITPEPSNVLRMCSKIAPTPNNVLFNNSTTKRVNKSRVSTQKACTGQTILWSLPNWTRPLRSVQRIFRCPARAALREGPYSWPRVWLWQQLAAVGLATRAIYTSWSVWSGRLPTGAHGRRECRCLLAGPCLTHNSRRVSIQRQPSGPPSSS